MKLEIAVNLSIRRISIGWHSPYCEVIDKFIIISIRLYNLKQYPYWFINLSLHFTHIVIEFYLQPLGRN